MDPKTSVIMRFQCILHVNCADICNSVTLITVDNRLVMNAGLDSQYYIVVQSLVINIGTCFASSYNVFLADDLSYGNVFRERSSRKTLP